MKRFDTDARITEILNAAGAFFAFNRQQFEDQKQEGSTYESIRFGLICPEGYGQSLLANLDSATSEKIQWELANNTKKDIIWYQLANHECQITCDYSEVVELLAAYGITKDEIKVE